MEWFTATSTFAASQGLPEVEATPDDEFARLSFEGIGAEIMGAGKFSPPGWHRDPTWKGWWGAEPPFHSPVVVPILLGRGSRLWDGPEGIDGRFDTAVVSTPSGVTHVTFTRRRRPG